MLGMDESGAMDGSVKDKVGDDVAVGASHAHGSVCASQTSAHMTDKHISSHGIVGPNGDGLTVGFTVGLGVTVGVGVRVGDGVGVAETRTIVVLGLVLAA
jgi:hypothetical protein